MSQALEVLYSKNKKGFSYFCVYLKVHIFQVEAVDPWTTKSAKHTNVILYMQAKTHVNSLLET